MLVTPKNWSRISGSVHRARAKAAAPAAIPLTSLFLKARRLRPVWWPIREICRNCGSEGRIGLVEALVEAPDSAVRAGKARLAGRPRQAQDRALIGQRPFAGRRHISRICSPNGCVVGGSGWLG